MVNLALPRHGVIDKPDPHLLEQRKELGSRVELDQEIERIRQKQEKQVGSRSRISASRTKS